MSKYYVMQKYLIHFLFLTTSAFDRRDQCEANQFG
jgi:hypothetical protein